MSSLIAKFFVGLVVIALTFTLSSCGKGEETTTTDAGNAEELRGSVLDAASQAGDTAENIGEAATEKAKEVVESKIAAPSMMDDAEQAQEDTAGPTTSPDLTD